MPSPATEALCDLRALSSGSEGPASPRWKPFLGAESGGRGFDGRKEAGANRGAEPFFISASFNDFATG